MSRQTQYRGTDRQGEIHLLGLVSVCCTADSAVDGTDRQTERQTDRQGEVHLLGLVGVWCTADSAAYRTD